MIDARELAAVAAGGFVGAVTRAELADALPHAADAWPWATFVANLVGAFVLGYAVVRLQERLPVSAYRRPLLGTGFCGALTTFSTMQVEVLRMLDAHAYGLVAGYVAASIAGGLACVQLAAGLVRRARLA